MYIGCSAGYDFFFVGGRNNQNKNRAVITVSVAMKAVVVAAAVVVDDDNMVPTNQVNASCYAFSCGCYTQSRSDTRSVG